MEWIESYRRNIMSSKALVVIDLQNDINMTKAGYTINVLPDCITSYDKKKLPEMMEYYATRDVPSLDLMKLCRSFKTKN